MRRGSMNSLRHEVISKALRSTRILGSMHIPARIFLLSMWVSGHASDGMRPGIMEGWIRNVLPDHATIGYSISHRDSTDQSWRPDWLISISGDARQNAQIFWSTNRSIHSPRLVPERKVHPSKRKKFFFVSSQMDLRVLQPRVAFHFHFLSAWRSVRPR